MQMNILAHNLPGDLPETLIKYFFIFPTEISVHVAPEYPATPRARRGHMLEKHAIRKTAPILLLLLAWNFAFYLSNPTL
jgi:hypothetical protein